MAGWGPAWVLRAKAVIPSTQGSRLAPALLCSALQISVLLGSVSLSGIWKPVWVLRLKVHDLRPGPALPRILVSSAVNGASILFERVGLWE